MKSRIYNLCGNPMVDALAIESTPTPQLSGSDVFFNPEAEALDLHLKFDLSLQCEMVDASSENMLCNDRALIEEGSRMHN